MGNPHEEAQTQFHTRQLKPWRILVGIQNVLWRIIRWYVNTKDLMKKSIHRKKLVFLYQTALGLAVQLWDVLGAVRQES